MIATIMPSRTSTPLAMSRARVALKSPTGRDLLDGAWWPRSRDLAVELVALVDELDPQWGRITRVAVNPMLWPVVPDKVTVHDHVVKIGWFTPELDPHEILLLSYGIGRWDLLVIPPETGDVSAARLMSAACARDERPLSATDLIAAETAREMSVGDRPQDAQESWEYEGGAVSIHARTDAGR
ncbi:DUF5994 family protein [Streptomyces sp. NPDC002853]